MTSDRSGDSTDEGLFQMILGWIGVHAALGGDEDTGCAKRGCGCARLVLLALVVLVVGNWFVNYFSHALWSAFLSALFALLGAVVAVAVAQLSFGPTAARRLQTAGTVTLGFGGACLVGVFAVMVGLPGTEFLDEEVSPQGGTLGPVTVEEPTWVGVEVRQSIERGRGTRYKRWSFVTAELLDEDKDYLSSFGGEFWHYAGYDDGESWREAEDDYEATILIPSAGTYYVRLKTEANVSADELRPIRFTMQERPWWGHPLPLQRSAYAAFFFGAVLFLSPWIGRARRVRQALEEGGTIRYEGATYAVRGTAQYEYPDWKAQEWTLQPLDPDEKKPLFVEYEYEEHSDWDNWAVSRPINASDIRCGAAGKEEGRFPDYLSQRHQSPETVSYENRTYSFDGRGKAYRNGKAFTYRNYEGPRGKRFVAVEGNDFDDLDAVVGTSISVRTLAVVERDAA